MLFTLRVFRNRVRKNKSSFRRFLSRLEKNPPKGLDSMTLVAEKEIWGETNCLSCANCCKTMTPTFTSADITRISSHLDMTRQQFKDKWLTKEKSTGDWINKSNPCQFLDTRTNMCSIYEVRPVDCAGFPHLPKKRMVDYMHVHKQNVEFCPATYRLVEKLMEKMAKS